MKMIQITTLAAVLAATSCLLASVSAMAQTASAANKTAANPAAKKKTPVSASRQEI